MSLTHVYVSTVCDFGFARTYMKGKRPYTLCGTEDWMVCNRSVVDLVHGH